MKQVSFGLVVDNIAGNRWRTKGENTEATGGFLLALSLEYFNSIKLFVPTPLNLSFN
jgi:hypothetical protein